MTGKPLPQLVKARLMEIFEGPEDERDNAIGELLDEHPEHADAIRRQLRKAEKVWREVLGIEPDKIDKIGPYHILGVLGEGGMGTVYVAEQREPVRRRVALKLIKLGMDSKQVLLRFEAERQALAMMEHNHIARVYDAGTTERGQPYFAMEYVKGQAITQYCDNLKLTVEERLTLFRQLGSGVQHAHQKGVIHRDLKPSNVLVTVQDGEPVVKIIDFGVARATDHRLVQATIFTEQGLILGTPEYMSPEQTSLRELDVDTRTDVYSLGVLLYELLVGELPFPPDELRQAGLREMERKITEEEPPKPSTRLSTCSVDTEDTTRKRRTDMRSLVRRLRADLDWVVMKAIDKDRGRRYETPDALAEDLRRHLEHEPVSAGPPSATYRLRKLARKYRTQAVASCLVLLFLIGGIIGTSIGIVRAREAEVEAKQRAEELERVAEFQATQLREIDPQKMAVGMRNEMLVEAQAAMTRAGLSGAEIEQRISTIDELLAGTNFTNLALDTLEANIFERALVAIDEQFADQQLVMAQLLQVIATTMRELGLLERATEPQARALEIRRRELGDDDPDTMTSINSMGGLLNESGKRSEAEPYFREALDRRRRVLGDDHPDTLTSFNNVGASLRERGKLAEAEPYFRDALDGRRRVLGDDDPATMTSINNMGLVLRLQGRLDEAEPYYREALERRRRVLGDDHPNTLVSIGNMGALLQNQGKLDEAESYLREALDGRRRVFGDEHRYTLASINSLGSLLRTRRHYEQSEALYREALERRRRFLGESHPDTVTSLNNLGVLLRTQRRFDEAEPYLRAAVAGARQAFGDHPNTLSVINGLASMLGFRKKYDEAEPYFLEAIELSRRINGDDHARTLALIGSLASLLEADGRSAEAVPYYVEFVQGHRRTEGEDDARVLETLNTLGALLGDQGKLDEAERYYREALRGRRRLLGNDHRDTLTSINRLGVLLRSQGRLEEAEPYYREALDGRRRTLGNDNPDTLSSINNMGILLSIQEKNAEAEPYLREALEGRLRVLGIENRATVTSFTNYLNVAAQVTESGDFEAAEPILRNAMEIARTAFGDQHVQTAGTLVMLGGALLAEGSFAEAEPILRECLSTRQAVLQSDDWSIYSAMSLLGASLAGQAKFAEAEPLLVRGYEQMNPPETRSSRKREALVRVVELYEDWGKPAEAANWRKLLDS